MNLKIFLYSLPIPKKLELELEIRGRAQREAARHPMPNNGDDLWVWNTAPSNATWRMHQIICSHIFMPLAAHHVDKFGGVVPIRPKVINPNTQNCAHIFEFLLIHIFFRGTNFLDLTFKAAPISDHVAKNARHQCAKVSLSKWSILKKTLKKVYNRSQQWNSSTSTKQDN